MAERVEAHFICRCGSPLELVAVDATVTEYVCPVHGPCGMFIDGGELDLGLVRESRPRSSSPTPSAGNIRVFCEPFESISETNGVLKERPGV